MESKTFICPECGLRHTIKQKNGMTRTEFFNSLPGKVLCEVNGCEGYAVPEEEIKV